MSYAGSKRRWLPVCVSTLYVRTLLSPPYSSNWAATTHCTRRPIPYNGMKRQRPPRKRIFTHNASILKSPRYNSMWPRTLCSSKAMSRFGNGWKKCWPSAPRRSNLGSRKNWPNGKTRSRSRRRYGNWMPRICPGCTEKWRWKVNYVKSVGNGWYGGAGSCWESLTLIALLFLDSMHVCWMRCLWAV